MDEVGDYCNNNFIGTSYMPGSVLSMLHALTQIILTLTP